MNLKKKTHEDLGRNHINKEIIQKVDIKRDYTHFNDQLLLKRIQRFGSINP